MKIMKRIAFALVVAMFAVTMAFATAAEDPTITVDTLNVEVAELNVGDEFEIKIDVTNNPGIVSMLLKVAYDDSLQIVSVNDSKFLGTSYTNTTNLTRNPFTLSWADDTAETNNTYNGTVFTFTFELLEVPSEPGKLDVTVSYDNTDYDIFNKDNDTVDFDVVNGGVNVTLKDMGNVYADDKIITYDGNEHNVADLIAIKGATLPAGATVTYVPETVKNVSDSGEVEITIEALGYETEEFTAELKINPKTVTIEGLKAQDKEYDKTTDAVITGGELKGVIGDDAVEANIPEIGTFASANVGTRIAVTYEEIVLSGDDAENYVLKTQPALTAKITACPVTITTKTLVKAGKLIGQDDPVDNYGYDIVPEWANEDLNVSATRKPGETKGEYPIDATYTSNSNYKVTVNKGVFSIDDKYVQEVVIPEVGELVYGGGDFNVTVTPDPDSGITEFTYESSNEDVVIVDVNGEVSIVGVGTATITITSEGNDEYKALNKTIDIVVVPMTITEIADIYYDGDELVIEIEDGTKIPVDIANATVEVDENDEVTLSDIALLNGNFVLDEEIVIPTFIAPAEMLIEVVSEDAENGGIEGTGKYLIGSTVTITPVANTGYRVKSVTVTETESGTEIETAETEDGEYVFTATVGATVTAEFAKRASTTVYPLAGSNKNTGTGTTAANKAASQIVLTIGSVEAQVYGETVENDVAPIIVKDRTMLPARFVAESLGAYVAWDAAQRKVTIHKNLTMIELYIDSDVAYINGSPVTLDSPAFIQNDRTYTPLRFIAEALGATVEWNELLRKVTITRN